MARRDEQLALETPAGRARKGRTEAAVDRDVRAARAAGGLTDPTGALVTSARVVARGLDVAEASRQVYAIRQLSNELRDLYVVLGLASAVGGDDSDDLAAILGGLGTAVAHT